MTNPVRSHQLAVALSVVNERGTHQPERVLLRIGSPGAGPGVKLVSSADGTTLAIMHNDRPLIAMKADGVASSIRMLAADGKEHTIMP
jgi:hypothetical protein